MSDIINHECGIALIRLLKPLDYYKAKYGTSLYGLKKLYILMEKQRNRGQEGAGIVSVKLDMDPGYKYMDRVRSCNTDPIQDVFNSIKLSISGIEKEICNCNELKKSYPYVSEIYLGHLRYATFGKNNLDNVHPLKRASNWRSRNLALAANFNLTNVDELFEGLIKAGQHPRNYSDTVTLLEKVGYHLDDEIQNRYREYRDMGYSREEISILIEKNLDIVSILSKSCKEWDGGYAVAGVTGHGDSFVVRDPWGIRPAYYYVDEEVVVVASEASVIKTAFGCKYDAIKEIEPGCSLIIKKDGTLSHERVTKKEESKSCSFERIYFSRGNDKEIYKERKLLGEFLAPKILSVVENDIANTVFSYIPNTAESAFLGVVKGVWHLTGEHPRVEKVVIKDAKLRTFITSDSDRDELVGHVYDVTYGVVNENENLVVIDDSIVRGTTLRKSILRILDTLNPGRIIIVSSAPQIRYPDCYGIDMTRMGEFIAFNAAIELLKESGRQNIIDDVYRKCKAQENLHRDECVNYVKEIYLPFTDDQISQKISHLIKDQTIKADVKLIFQSVENLNRACPKNRGDWYFTGDYPTPGGNKVAGKAFVNWVEGVKGRSY